MDGLQEYLDIAPNKVQDGSRKTSTFKRISNAAYAFSYCAVSGEELSARTVKAILFIVSIQSASYALAEEASYPWHPTIFKINNVLKYFNYGFATTWTVDSNQTGILFVGVFAFVSAFIISVCYSSVALSESKRSPAFLGIVLHFCILNFTLFFQPIITILCSPFHCNGEQTVFGSECGSLVHILVVVLSTVCILLFTALGAFYHLAVVHEHRQTAVDTPWGASSHGRVTSLVFITRGVCSFAFATSVAHHSVLEVQSTTQVLLVTAVAFAALARLVLIVYYLPFYSRNTNSFHSGLFAMEAWIALSLCVCMLFNNPTNTGAVFLGILAMPFFLFFVRVLTSVRERQILASPWSLINSPFIAEVKLRLTFQKDAGEPPFAHKNKRRVGAMQGSQKVENLSSEEADLWRDVANIGVFKRSSFLLLEIANMYSIRGNDELTAGRYFRRALQGDCPMDTKFFLYRFQRRLEEGRQGSQAHVLTQVQFETQLRHASQLFVDAHEEHLLFWKLLDEHASDSKTKISLQGISVLFAQGRKTRKRITETRQELESLVKISDGAPRALQLYSEFALDLLNDPIKASKLALAAREAEEQVAGNVDHEQIADDNAGFNEARDGAEGSNALAPVNGALGLGKNQPNITISGEEDNLGDIVAVSSSCCKMFGVRKKQILGTKIDNLCPNPFSGAHDVMMKRYLDTTKPHILNKTRMVFGLHHRGYLFPINLHVTPVTTLDGRLSFLGKFTAVVSSSCFVLMKEDGQVTGLTKELFDTLNITKEDLEQEAVNVTSFLEPQVLSSSFNGATMSLATQFTPRGTFTSDTLFRVKRMKIQLNSDSKHYPYTISLIMLRLKPLLGDSEVTSVAGSNSQAVPLGFAEASVAQDACTPKSRNKFVTLEKDEEPLLESGNVQQHQLTRNDVKFNTTHIDSKKESPHSKLTSVNSNGKHDSRNRSPTLPETTKEQQEHDEGKSRQRFISPSEIEEQRRSNASIKETMMTNQKLEQSNEEAIVMQTQIPEHEMYPFQEFLKSLVKTPDKHIRRLHRQFLAMVFTIIFIGIIVCTWSILSLDSYLNSVKSMTGTLQRSAWISQVANEIMTLERVASFSNSTMLGKPLMQRLNETHDLLLQIRELHEELGDSSFGDVQYSIEFPGAVHLESLRPTKPQMVSNLFVSGSDFVSHALHLIKEISETGSSYCEHCMRYVIQDGPQHIVQASNEVATNVFLMSQQALRFQELYNIVGLTLVVIFVIGIVVLDFRPAVFRVQKSKVAVARAFWSIPTKSLHAVTRRCSNRLDAVRETLESLDDDGDDDFDSDESDCDASEASGANTNRSRTASKGIKHAKQVNNRGGNRISVLNSKGFRATTWGKPAFEETQTNNTTRFQVSRIHRRCWNHFAVSISILFRLGLLIATTVGYFGALYYVEIALDDSLLEQSSHMTFAGNRIVQTQLLRHWLLQPDNEISFEEWRRVPSANLSESLIQSLMEIDHQLTVGNSPGEILQELTTEHERMSSEQLALVFEDGCNLNLHPICAQASTELRQGLHLGFLHFVTQAKAFVASNLARDHDNWKELLPERYRNPVLSQLITSRDQWHELDNSTFSSNQFWETSAISFYLDDEQSALTASLHESFRLYMMEGDAMANSLIATRIGAILVFCTLLLGEYWFIFRKVIFQLEVDLKDTHSMLLMLPRDVVQNTKELQDHVKRFMSEERECV